MNTLGDRIKYCRTQAGLSQQELAKMVDVDSKATVSGWEINRRTPEIATISKLAKIFNISLEWLIDGEGPSPKKSNECNEESKKPSFWQEVKQNMAENSAIREKKLIEREGKIREIGEMFGFTEEEVEILRLLRRSPNMAPIIHKVLEGQILIQDAIREFENINPKINKDPLPDPQ